MSFLFDLIRLLMATRQTSSDVLVLWQGCLFLKKDPPKAHTHTHTNKKRNIRAYIFKCTSSSHPSFFTVYLQSYPPLVFVSFLNRFFTCWFLFWSEIKLNECKKSEFDDQFYDFDCENRLKILPFFTDMMEILYHEDEFNANGSCLPFLCHDDNLECLPIYDCRTRKRENSLNC